MHHTSFPAFSLLSKCSNLHLLITNNKVIDFCSRSASLSTKISGASIARHTCSLLHCLDLCPSSPYRGGFPPSCCLPGSRCSPYKFFSFMRESILKAYSELLIYPIKVTSSPRVPWGKEKSILRCTHMTAFPAIPGVATSSCLLLEAQIALCILKKGSNCRPSGILQVVSACG